MKREIKFRAWDSVNKVMELDIHTTDGLYSLGQVLEMTDFEVMQYTGLVDRNGTPIFEGDILAYKSSHPNREGQVFNNVVEFTSGQSLCGWRMRNKGCVVKATPFKFRMSEIIGNIYETPELLK